MGGSIKKQISGLLRSKKNHKYQVSLILCLALIVALGTVAVLKLPGVAMTHQEKVLDCHFTGNAAHTHNDDCYDANGVLVCSLAERPLHTHDESCYTAETYLACGQEESAGHQHSDSCYTLVRGDLICGQEESEEHEHSDDCYDWTEELTCGYYEGEGAHEHTDACYETVETLTCGMEELTEEHIHGEECFTVVELTADEVAGLNDEPAEEPAAEAEADAEAAETDAETAAAEEKPAEEPEAEVADLTDGKFDADELFENADDVDDVQGEQGGDPNADVETWSDWDAMFVGMQLTGNWDEDLIAVAKTQIGYTESTANYIINEEGKSKGYTRYGEWYGSPYGDWCAMFVSFCLNYAEVPTSYMPIEASCPRWVDKLTNWGIYEEAGAYDPQPGDLIFFTRDGYNAAHVGIVYDVADGTIETIEGNSADSVRYVMYNANDWHILGYGKLPVNPDAPAPEAAEAEVIVDAEGRPAQYFEAWAGDVRVSVNAPEGAFPEGTIMYVEMVEDDSVIAAAAGAAGIDQPVGQAVNITFMYNDEEIEPAVPIAVTMSSDTIADFEQPFVVHVTDDGSAQVVNDAAKVADEVSFDAGEFSVYAVLTDFINGFGYPKQQFEAVAGDVTVTVTAERGAFPKNSQMVVTEVATEEVYDAVVAAVGNTAEAVRAVDITFLDADGEPIEPRKPISVTMTSVAVAQVEEPVIVHVDDNGNADVVESEVAEDAVEDISFESDAFSIYVIVDDSGVVTPRVTYHFQNTDGSEYKFLNTSGESVSFQIIKNNEKLINVGQPQYEVSLTGGKKFAGWYPVDPETGAFTSNVSLQFDTPIPVTGNEENKDVYVRPAFGDVAYIEFYENTWDTSVQSNNIFNMVQILLQDNAGTYDTSLQAVTAPKSNLAFAGWSNTAYTPVYTGEGTADYTDTANVSYASDTREALTGEAATITVNQKNSPYKLYPIFKTVHWLHFSTSMTQRTTDAETGDTVDTVVTGQSYTAPASVAYGAAASVAKPADPTWMGYTFLYWSETQPIYNSAGILQNPDDVSQFDWSKTLDSYSTDDITLYAVWANANAKYTVVFWQQVVTDERDATTPTKAQMTAAGYKSDKTLKHYEYGGQVTLSEATNGTVTVNDDLVTRALAAFVAENADNAGKFNGFEINYSLSDTSMTVKGDSSTVVHVYMDREKIYIKFYHRDGYTSDPGYTSDVWDYATSSDGYQWVEQPSGTTPANGVQYYAKVGDDYYPVSYEYTTKTEYYLAQDNYDGAPEYTGTVYTLGAAYSLNNTTLNECHYYSEAVSRVYNNDYYYYSGGTYAYVDTRNGPVNVSAYYDGNYTKLNWKVRTVPTYTYTYEKDGEQYPYNGNLFTKESVTQNGNLTVFWGLYGQQITKYYTSGWPSNASWTYYQTNNSKSGLVYLGQFKIDDLSVRDTTNKEMRLYYTGNTGTVYAYYLQNVDGTYTRAAAGGASNGGTFTIVNKYEGYTVAGYRRWTGSENNKSYIESKISAASGTQVQMYATSGGGPGGGPGGPGGGPGGETTYYSIDVYYDLLNYNLNYIDSKTGQPLTGINSASVPYTKSLSSYNPTNFTPTTTRPGQVWDGKWYKDQACTEEFDWTVTMPTHDMAVYAGWTDEWYRVEIEPDGGELTGTDTTNESTYFWSKYGGTVQQYKDVVRYYVEDKNGEYYYYENLWHQDWPDSADGDPSARRRAGYVSISDYEALQGRPDSELTPLEICIRDHTDTTTKYKYDDSAYSLLGWYNVDSSGHTTTPYVFGETITGKVRIRAVWRIVGEYKVRYSTDVVDANGQPVEKNGVRMTATNVPSDANKYADKSDTVVFKQPDAIEGYTFLGWYYDGQLYQAGNVYKIKAELADESKTVTLYPAYVPTELAPVKTISVIFNANGGTTSLTNGTAWVVPKDATGSAVEHEVSVTVSGDKTTATLSPLALNEAFELYGASDFKRTGYELIGWNTDKTKADQGIVKFNLGANVGADDLTEEADATNDSANTVYAVWKLKPLDVTVMKVVDGSAEDEAQSYTFTPVFVNANGQRLGGVLQENFDLTNGGFKLFEDSVYLGYKVVVRENANDGISTAVTVKVTDDDGTELEPVIGEDGVITITGNTTITFTNTRAAYPVRIQKTNDDGAALSGAEFTIDYDVNGDGEIDANDKLTSDPNGWLLGGDNAGVMLPVGSYTLTETKAPAGYVQLNKDITITVDKKTGVRADQGGKNVAEKEYLVVTEGENGETIQSDPVWTVKITNSTGQVLPHTGGVGTTIFYVVGGVLVVGAIALLVTKRRVRKDEGDDE